MLAFTTDTWTSRANDRYTSLTLHYLDGNFDIKNYTLDIFCMPKAHTSEDLQSLLQTSIVEWGLDKCGIKIFFVTDNTAKIVEAIRLGRTWERIPCFAHTLQLVIKDAIEDSIELVRILKKCKDVIKGNVRRERGVIFEVSNKFPKSSGLVKKCIFIFGSEKVPAVTRDGFALGPEIRKN